MPHRIPEPFHCLTRQNTTRGVRDRTGDHDGQALTARVEHFFDRKNCGLCIKRVKNCFDQDQIDSAI